MMARLTDDDVKGPSSCSKGLSCQTFRPLGIVASAAFQGVAVH